MTKKPLVAGIYLTEYYADCLIGEFSNYHDDSIGIKNPKTSRIPFIRIERENLTPEQFLIKCAQHLARKHPSLKSVAIACFGPFQSLDYSVPPSSYSNYGALTNGHAYTDWHGIHIYHIFNGVFSENDIHPITRIYTDVDAAAYGEYLLRYNNDDDIAKELRDNVLVYLQFSRSVNGGIAFNGNIWRGRLHPLMSIHKPKKFQIMDDSDKLLIDPYTGCCDFHDDCIEGLIGIKALEERTGKFFEDIPNDHWVWEYVVYYIANLCISVTGIIAPSKIILGGRVIKENSDPKFSQQLLRRIRGYYYESLQGPEGMMSPNYYDVLAEHDFIDLPEAPNKKRGPRPGMHGAIRLAAHNYSNSK